MDVKAGTVFKPLNAGEGLSLFMSHTNVSTGWSAGSVEGSMPRI